MKNISTDPIYIKVTPIVSNKPLDISKHMIMNEGENGLIPRDSNGNGYYKIPQVGKIDLIQLFSIDEDKKNLESESNGATCVMQTLGGGTAYGLHEVLTREQYQRYLSERDIIKGDAR